MTHREEMDKRIKPVRELLGELTSRLSAHTVQSARQLLDNDEPNEALIVTAWGIATNRVEMPAQVLAFIEQTVGDPRDLPVDLTGRSGPPVRRPAPHPTPCRL